MARTCTVCTHPDRNAIDEFLVGSGASNRRIAAQYGLAEASVRRHKKEHLPETLVKAEGAQEVARAESLSERVERLEEKALSILVEAEASGELRTALAAVKEARGCLELRAKLVGKLDERPQVNVNISQEWVNIRTTILKTLEGHPEAKQAVVEALNGHTS